MTTAATTLAGDPATTSPGANPQPGGNSPPNPTPGSSGWWDSVPDAQTKEWLASKNYPSANEAFVSAHNLEKLFGADKAGRTVLLITHRLAALEDRVDEVLVLESGRVVERGSPGELMRAGGRYAHYQDYLLE